MALVEETGCLSTSVYGVKVCGFSDSSDAREVPKNRYKAPPAAEVPRMRRGPARRLAQDMVLAMVECER